MQDSSALVYGGFQTILRIYIGVSSMENFANPRMSNEG